MRSGDTHTNGKARLDAVIATRDVGKLAEYLGDEKPSFRAAAAEALGSIGDAYCRDNLLRAMKDRSSFVRRAAAASLGNFKERRAIESLITALSDGHDEVRQEAAKSLSKIGELAVDPLIGLLYQENMFETVSKILDGMNCAWRETPSGKSLIAVLLHRMKDVDPLVRKAAAETSGKIRAQQSVQPLITALADRTWEVRSASARALGLIKEEMALCPLISSLSDGDARVRAAAAEALGAMKSAKAIPALITCLRDREMAHAASNALTEIGEPAIEPLASCLVDADDYVHNEAGATLYSLGDGRGWPLGPRIMTSSTSGPIIQD